LPDKHTIIAPTFAHVTSTLIDRLLYTSSPQYPRCLAHRHKSSCIMLSASYSSAHYVQGCCHPAGFQKLKKGLLDNNAYGYTNHTYITISSCVRRLTRWLPRSNDLFLTLFDIGALHQRILDISFVFETGWHMDWMAIWSGV